MDLSNYSDATRYIYDLFGDIANVPTGIRYNIYISGDNGIKLDFPLTYKTNITTTHTPPDSSEEKYTIPYSGAAKIEFTKLKDNLIWVVAL